jgi:putative acetyltransferase
MREMAVVPIEIAPERPDQPEIRAFFAASDAYMAALYPADSNHMMDVAALTRPNVHFLVARRGGKAIGCGAIVEAGDGSAEIKRMWVLPEVRGDKTGEALLAALEVETRARGIQVLRLETGIWQPEAIALYHKLGFIEIPPFGDYKFDALSLFMEKQLT